jgi:glutathione S-transferase
MLTVHHLGHSQSERIVWLCEELEIPYELIKHDRDPVTGLAPPAFRALHTIGAAPVIEDDGQVLAESAAIVDYIIARHGDGRLRLGPDHPDFASYLYWFHFANGNLQPVIMRLLVARRAGLTQDHPVLLTVERRLNQVMAFIEERSGEAEHLAGGKFTAADIMSVFSLTTMRLFQPLDLQPYPNILAYLQRIGARPAYRRAMAKGDPDLVPMLT